MISKHFVKSGGYVRRPDSVHQCTLTYGNITLYNVHNTMRYIIIQPLGARVYGDVCIHIVQCTYTYYDTMI